MKVLFVAAELSPLIKVGGLADVIGSLPAALVQLGVDVRVIIPGYKVVTQSNYKNLLVKDGKFTFTENGEPSTIELAHLQLGQVYIYLVQSSRYFCTDSIYPKDELEQFLFFSRAVIYLLPHLQWQPDIIHAHDWHTALIPLWVKDKNLAYRTVFTIHNLAYQGSFSRSFLTRHKLGIYWRKITNELTPPLNFISQGIIHADKVSTVSRTYAEEILKPKFGMGLSKILQKTKSALLGITNGIDYKEYDPSTDANIYVNYDLNTLPKKSSNKMALQRDIKLTVDADIPLIGMVQRLEEQKGLDIFIEAADEIMRKTDAQIVIQGLGRPQYETILAQLASRFSGRIAVLTTFDTALAHKIYAGSDMFLMPSLYEPCGLGQLIAMRYGTLPIVRHTGGLVDTVAPLTQDLVQGSGFVFYNYSAESLLSAIERATRVYRNQSDWQMVMKRVMNMDFSWRSAAIEYQKMYTDLFKL